MMLFTCLLLAPLIHEKNNFDYPMLAMADNPLLTKYMKKERIHIQKSLNRMAKFFQAPVSPWKAFWKSSINPGSAPGTGASVVVAAEHCSSKRAITTMTDDTPRINLSVGDFIFFGTHL